MTSIRTRLFVILLAATSLVWVSAFVWIQKSTRAEVERVLDARLAEAGQMVSSLISDQRIDLSTAAAAVTRAPVIETSYSHRLSCQIWSLDGQLVGQSGGAPSEMLTEADSGFSIDIVDGEAWRVFTVINTELGLRVIVGDSQLVRDRLVRDVTKGLVIPAILVLPFLAGLIWISLRSGLQPLERLAASLKHRCAGNLEPLPVTGMPDEIQPVGLALNGLLDRVKAARDRETVFTAYAAHELKTPLAAINTHAQIALMAKDQATRDNALVWIRQGVARTDRLVRQLLALAQVDGAEIRAFEELDPARLARQVIDDLSALALVSDVTVTLTSAPGTGMSSDPTLLNLALRNLLENAILASPRGSCVQVQIDPDDRDVLIHILDAGTGIPACDRARITERFYRGAAAANGGSGLGLAIVETAIARLGGRLAFAPRPGGGEIFTVTIRANARTAASAR